jgi:hypothetical protein
LLCHPLILEQSDAHLFESLELGDRK